MLEQSLLDACRGERIAIVLAGEPGIGKTRLLEWLCERAGEKGFEVLAGRGSELEHEVPFGAVVDALDERLGALEPVTLKRLGEEPLAELGAVFPSLARVAGRLTSGLEVERYRCFEAVRTVIGLLTRERRVLLALDDVHWADQATVELVSHLLRRRVPRLLLALTYRPRQAQRQLDRAVREGALRALELRPLSLEEATQLLGSTLDAHDLRAVYHDSGGVPFYVEQLARAARGLARRGRPVVVGELEGDTEVPAPVRAAIACELDQLAPAARRLAQGAAVAGERFDLDLAAVIGELDDDSACAALDDLIAADLVRPTGVPRQLVFRHPIVRRATYDGERVGWRLDAHKRAAHALATRGAAIGLRAHHVERSAAVGDEDAIATLTEAGQAAAARAPAAAARWFRAAFRLLPDTAQPERRLPLLVALATALGAIGHLQDCREVLSEALELSPPDARGELIAVIARTEQGLGRSDDAGRLLADALAGAEPGSREAVALTIELAHNDLMVGAFDEAAAAAAAARAQAVTVHDRPLYFAATVVLAWSHNYLGEIADAQAYRGEAADIVDAVPDEQLVSYLEAQVTLVFVELSHDCLHAAAAHARRGLRASRAFGQGHLSVRFQHGLAVALMLQGHLAQARTAAEIAVEASQLLDNDLMRATTGGLRCWIASQQGETAAALAAGQEAVQAAERVPGSRSLLAWMAHVCYGEALLEAGWHEQARQRIYAAGGPELTDVQRDARPHWYKVLAVAELAAGRTDAAETMAQRAEAAAASFGLERAAGDAQYARAAVLLARGTHKLAADIACNAAACYDSVGHSLSAARARLLAGRALALAGERAAAERELESAHSTFESCGALRLRDQAAKELRRLGKRVAYRRRPRGADEGQGSLTDRELEIAERVARGYSNRQIAAELYLSEKTIERHLTHAFAKVGVSSRSALAATIERWHSGQRRL